MDEFLINGVRDTEKPMSPEMVFVATNFEDSAINTTRALRVAGYTVKVRRLVGEAYYEMQVD